MVGLENDPTARAAGARRRQYLVEGERSWIRRFTRRDVDRWLEWPNHPDPLYSPYNPLPMTGPMRDAWYDDLVHRQAQLPFAVDRFNQWLSVDPVTGEVNVSFYDTRNDTTGAGYTTDVYFTQSADGGSSWLSPNVRVTTESSNEHDCNGLFPCPGIDYLNQYGDYEGLVSYGGVSHPIWTDSRRQLEASAGCRTDLAMEEVVSATVH